MNYSRMKAKRPERASVSIPVEQVIEEAVNAGGWFHTSDFQKAFKRITGCAVTSSLANQILRARHDVRPGRKASNSWRYDNQEGACRVAEDVTHVEHHSRSDVALGYFLRSVETASREELARPDRMIADAFAAADAFVMASAEDRA